MVVVVWIGSWFSSSATPTDSVTTHVLLGQQGFLRTSAGSTITVGITKDAYDAYYKAVSANDEIGYSQLLNANKIFSVPDGTKVLVIDSSWGYDQIRFVDGIYTGESAWVNYESIKTD